MAREKSGDTNMAAGRYAEAVTDFQAAGGLNPGEARYSQKAAEATRQRDALLLWQEGQNLEKTHKLREAAFAYQRAVELVPGNKEYVAAVTRLDSMKKSRLDSYKLQLKSSQPITLQFNETRVKDIFNVVSQLSGITFVFDNDVKDQSLSISLTNANFYQALDLLTSMSKLGRKVLNESTILLYTRTPDKIKQYEDMVVRIYNLNYLDAKKAIAFIKGLLQIRKLQQHDEGNAIAIRDTQEVADVVAKIIDATDAEVVLDVEVIEVNQKNTHDLGLLLSNYSVSLGAFSPQNKILSPYLYTPSPSQTPTDYTQLLQAFSINKFGGYVTVPSASYNFGKTLAKGEVLSNPKLRVKNREKAKFNVGQRVPVQTTTQSNGTVTATNIQYIDVGIKMNAEPIIQIGNDVVVKLSLEASTVIGKEISKSDG